MSTFLSVRAVLHQLHPAQGASLIGTPPGIRRPVRVLGPGLGSVFEGVAWASFCLGCRGRFILALERVVFVADDYILREGEFGADMYFIASGA